MELKVLAAVAMVAVLVLASAPAPATGQAVTASCTASLITSFTPCFSFITGSASGNGTAAGAAPTADCCRSLAAVINTSTSCACLILTGNVPLGIPINRTLAVTLPQACNAMSVPLQCRDTSAQIPIPGVPVAISPAMPALPPTPPESKAPQTESPTSTPPATSEGKTRPQVLPSSAWRISAGVPACLLLLAAMLF
ncbi:hypothetical protein ABZP36_002238 [Zizania latifolia]